MRLSDLTNPSHYMPTEADLTGFLEAIGRIWPDHTEYAEVRFQAKAAAQVEEKIFDAISGMQCLNRQWR